MPDLVGVGVVTAAIASLALGITQGSEWGWTSWRVLGAFAAALVLAPIAVQRSRHRDAPAIDLEVFRSRTVALANAGTLVYALGFFAMLLGNVLFLTRVWDYSTLRAGLAITPGPLVVAALSSTTGRLAAKYGYKPVLVTGSLLFALGEVLIIMRVHTTPAYLRDWLPSAMLVGLGVAFTFPVLSAAAVSGLPAEKFGVGGAINQTSRQLGAVLGVALLVSLLGSPATADAALRAFQHVWWMSAGAGVLCAALALGHVRVVRAPVASQDGTRSHSAVAGRTSVVH